VDILDGEVNRVTNELNFLGTILNGIELTEVDFGEADLLDGSLLLGLVLSGSLSGHGGERSVVVDNRLLGSLSSTLSTLTVVTSLATASTSGVTSTSTVVLLVLAATSSTSLVVSSGVVSVLSLSLVHVTSVLLLHTAEALHHSVLLFGSLVFAVSEPVEHLSLLTGVLLVLKFLLGYPEVNADRSVAEGSVLVKALNSVFGVIHILVEDKALLV
jgi:hypothetical protein